MSNYTATSDSYLAAAASYYGSIIDNVEKVAIERGFVTRNGTVNINTLSAVSGVSTSTLWYLLKDKRRFRSFNLVTLAKLCFALRAQPGDLLAHVPGGSDRGLGYSSDAFVGLLGTQGRGSEYTDGQDSEYAGTERSEERASLSDVV